MRRMIGEQLAARIGNFTLEQKNKVWATEADYEKKFYVISEGLDDTEYDIINTSGIPPLTSYYIGAYCTGLSARELDRIRDPGDGEAAILWEVSAKFDSRYDGSSNNNGDPTSETPKPEWDNELENEVLERDVITGQPITTKCGEPIIVTFPYSYSLLMIPRIEQHPFDPRVQFFYISHINATPFWGAPRGCVLMLKIPAKETVIDQKRYQQVEYHLKFKMRLKVEDFEGSSDSFADPDSPWEHDTWQAHPLHQGYKRFVDSTNESSASSAPSDRRIAIQNVDKHGNPVICNLDEFGFRLPIDRPPVYLSFNRFPYAEFNVLDLGPFD